MATMTAKRGSKSKIDWRSDAWLWPSALIMMMGGWGQVLWMWQNIRPAGLAPLWLLLWVGVGVAGTTLLVYWFARRWWPVAMVALLAWVGVSRVNDLAQHYGRAVAAGQERWYRWAPLLSLALLGIGLSGAMMTLAWLVGRRWPGSVGFGKLTTRPGVRPLRQGVWTALFAMLCGWLLINRAFTPAAAGLLGGAFVLLEAFFLIREAPR